MILFLRTLSHFYAANVGNHMHMQQTLDRDIELFLYSLLSIQDRHLWAKQLDVVVDFVILLFFDILEFV